MTQKVISWFSAFAFAFIIAVFIRLFFIDVYVLEKNGNDSYFSNVFFVKKNSKLQKGAYAVFKFKNETRFGRIVALGGDTVALYKKNLIVNRRFKPDTALSFRYAAFDTKKKFEQSFLLCDLDLKTADSVRKQKVFLKLREYYPDTYFVFDSLYNNQKLLWNPDFYGPLIVPFTGMTIVLDTQNIAKYFYVMKKEMSDLKTDGNLVWLDGKKINEYVFINNYFFILNDERDCFDDSRNYGFIKYEKFIGIKL